MVIGLCVGAAWSVREAQRREGVLAGRLAALESSENSQQGELAALGKQLKGQLQNGLARVESAAAGLARVDALAAELTRVDTLAGELARVETAAVGQLAVDGRK